MKRYLQSSFLLIVSLFVICAQPASAQWQTQNNPSTCTLYQCYVSGPNIAPGTTNGTSPTYVARYDMSGGYGYYNECTQCIQSTPASKKTYITDPIELIGIGTTSPLEKLQVVGNVKVEGTNNGIIFPDGSKLTSANIGTGGTSPSFNSITLNNRNAIISMGVPAPVSGVPIDVIPNAIYIRDNNTMKFDVNGHSSLILNSNGSVNVNGVFVTQQINLGTVSIKTVNNIPTFSNSISTSPALAVTGKAITNILLSDRITTNELNITPQEENINGYVLTSDVNGNGTWKRLPAQNPGVWSKQLNGSETLEFGAGVAGKEVSAGKIGYGTFSSGQYLDIVGAGTTNANRKIQFFNEGGAKFNGDIFTGGRLYQSGTLTYAENSYTRAVVGNNIFWDVVAKKWKQMDGGQYNDLSSIHFTDWGGLEFYARGFDPAKTEFTHAELKSFLRMKISSDGKVVIGNETNATGGLKIPGTDTDYKLAVQGKIVGYEVVASAPTNWADYVFEDSYKLPELTEVEAFIKTNKHLPTVPSAKEVSEKGINMGEMDAKLLQQIEHLMLYVIRQQKEIEALKAKIKN